MIDLHTHSRCSDGLDEPEALVEKAVRAGLTALALADHDTVDGLARFSEAGLAAGLRTVPCVELDTDHAPGALHILGYFIDPENADLSTALRRMRAGRRERLAGTLRALTEQGLALDEAEVLREAGQGSIGRPHIARRLVARGYVRSVDEAFARFLAEGQPCYVPRPRLTPEEAIRLIRAAHGVPVLAHPKSLRMTETERERLLDRLCDAGLGGMEVYYPDHTTAERRRFLRMALRRNLAVSGGSDYHGEQPGRPRLGTGYGTLSVPDAALETLSAAIRLA